MYSVEKPAKIPVAEFINPWLGDKVDYGIGLSYRPASHVACGVSVQQLHAGVDFISQSGIYEFGYSNQLAGSLVSAPNSWSGGHEFESSTGRNYVCSLKMEDPYHTISWHCKKKVSHFIVPSRNITNKTLPGREYLNYSQPGRVWLVPSRLGTGKSLTFFQCNHWQLAKHVKTNQLFRRKTMWLAENGDREAERGQKENSAIHAESACSVGIF